MRIGILDNSHAGLSRPDLERIAAALERQLYEHYAPLWQADGVDVRVYDSNISLGGDVAPLVIYDTADQAGELGYHAVADNGMALGRVFLAPIFTNGGTLTSGPLSVSVTASHEALEMCGDPYVNAWVDVDGTYEEARELCDRVEGDSYDIDGVCVSNFCGPRSFRPGAGPYDYLGLTQGPFQVRPGGYAIRRSGGPAGPVTNVWGGEYPEWRKALKQAGRAAIRALRP